MSYLKPVNPVLSKPYSQSSSEKNYNLSNHDIDGMPFSNLFSSPAVFKACERATANCFRVTGIQAAAMKRSQSAKSLSNLSESVVGRPRLPLVLAILSLMVDFGTPQVLAAARKVV